MGLVARFSVFKSSVNASQVRKQFVRQLVALVDQGRFTLIGAYDRVEGRFGGRVTEPMHLTDAPWARIAPLMPIPRYNYKCPRDRCWRVGCS